MKQPYIISQEQQVLLLQEIIQLVKEFYGPCDSVIIRVSNLHSDGKYTRKVQSEDDVSVTYAELTISESSVLSSATQKSAH